MAKIGCNPLVALMRRIFHAAAATVILAQMLAPAAGRAQTDNTGPAGASHLTVELITRRTAIAPGQPFLAGLQFTIEPRWHIYWINAGDAGEPPRIDWKLPKSFTAGPLQFPARCVCRSVR